MFDLSLPGSTKVLADRISAAIDAHCVEKYDGGHRNHMGASLLGRPCERQLWSTFRWLKHEVHSGRTYRLFNRGHREEERFVEWLRGIGFTVWEVDDADNQYRVTACNGHFGGSLDGVGIAPREFGVDQPMLLEFKTAGTGAGFASLSQKGVRLAKPEHYTQMCIYGRSYSFQYALYMCICKNDDDLYVEIVKLDWDLADQQLAKAERLINLQYAPAKISETPAYHVCKYCAFAGTCHGGEQPEVNCRSCQHATPVADAQWSCAVHRSVIPKDVLASGCGQWRSIV
jgi:hypothetical protein